jgi:hypothetical protein
VKRISKFFRLISTPEITPAADVVEIQSLRMPVIYRRHARAKNYVLRLHADKTVVVTLPQRGSKKLALEFVASRKEWLEKQWKILQQRNLPPHILKPGMEILYHGRPVALQLEKRGTGWELCVDSQRFCIDEPADNLRPAVEAHLLRVARNELVTRGLQLAREHGAQIRKVVVRNQKSRWGSCSYNGTISLNWRLVQLPPHVRDYIIVHELAHLRELNHSPRFWSEVEKICPNYRHSEKWLKENSCLVGF